MEPLVYIITINYNSSIHTIEMVKSVLDSDYNNFKIVIIDNNSIEEEKKKLRVINNDKVRIIELKKNLGFSGGNNIGLKLAIKENAKYMMLLNNDTIIEKDAISKMVETLEKNKADVVCPKILSYYDRSLINYAGGKLSNLRGLAKFYGFNKNDGDKYNYEKEITFASGCCIMTSFKNWQKVNFMSEKYFLYFEDNDLSVRFQKNNLKMLYVPQARIYHKESMSTKKFSESYQYYFSRNAYLFIKDNIKFPMKLFAYLFTTSYFLFCIWNQSFQVRNIVNGIKAFKNGETGVKKEKNGK